MATTCYIYTLHASNDPTCRPRYVGFTVRLVRRAIEHNTGHECGRKNQWIKSLRSEGAKAIMTVVHTFESDDGLERGIVEADWIEKYRDEFQDLLNDAPGGFGLAPCSPELRARRKVMNKGRVHSAETRAKVRASKIGKPRPPHVIEAMRRANLGRKLSSETREKMSRSKIGKKPTAESLAKMSKAQKGRKPSEKCFQALRWANFEKTLSPEHKAKLAAANRGKTPSPETLAKRSAKLRGKKRTPEQCERIKQAAIRRWANHPRRNKE